MKKNLILAAILGIIAIVLGAFGAHTLKEQLEPEAFKSFETAVHYQMYHVLALLFINGFQGFSNKTKNTVSYLFILGILLFSGSIYAIRLLGIAAKTIWFVTPLGGISFILGWILMLIALLRKK